MTGIQPETLLADEQIYGAAVEQAEHAEWSTLHELLALSVETADRAIRQGMANAGVKSGNIPQPLRIPRPGQKDAPGGDGAIVMRPHEFAAALRDGGV